MGTYHMVVYEILLEGLKHVVFKSLLAFEVAVTHCLTAVEKPNPLVFYSFKR